MELKLRKFTKFVDKTFVEGGKKAKEPVLLVSVAAVFTNPWDGQGYVEDLKPMNSKIVGAKHIKSVLIGPEGTSLKTIAFNATDSELGAYLLKKNNKTFNIAGKLSLNEWKGQKNVEFIIDDISVNKNNKNTVPSSIG